MKKGIEMKKIFVFFALLLLSLGRAWAVPVSGEEAMAAADVWAAENAAFKVGVHAVKVFSVCDTNSAKTVLWHQVSMSGGGCLIMAPVTEIEPVVAALEIDPGQMPANHPLRNILTFDMRKRLKFLGLYKEDSPSPGRMSLLAAPSSSQRSEEELTVAKNWGKKQDSKWKSILARAPKKGIRLLSDATKGVVDPIAIQIGIVDGFEYCGRFTHWHQLTAATGDDCYNYYTPEGSPCGCVATAMSAVLQYFGCPGVCAPDGGEVITDAADAPTSDLCTFNNESCGTLACIGLKSEEDGEISYAYDWSIFDDFTSLWDYYDPSKMDEAHCELLGRVAYNAGVMLNMQWTPFGSSSFTIEIVNVLRDNFGFTDARYVTPVSQEAYAPLIYQQCWAGKPVILRIDGHSVLAVGYGKDGDGVDRVRVFMGWGGVGDAWYALPWIDASSVPYEVPYLSDIVDGVVTMLAVNGEGAYPVCGRLMPSGTATNVTVGSETVRPNAEGYFAVRAGAETRLDVSCRLSHTFVTIGEDVECENYDYFGFLPNDDIISSTCKYYCDCDLLAAVTPGSFILPLVNFSTAVTTPNAKELALTEGKLIFAYNDNDDAASRAVFDVIKRISDENYANCTNRYVFIAIPYADYSVYEFLPNSPVTQADYKGVSYGIFDPRLFEPAKRWAYTNGRLAYNRASAYVLDENNVPVATAETEAAIKAVLERGWEQYMRSLSAVKLTVRGTPDEPGTVTPGWGVHDNAYVNQVYQGYTNGEEVVFSAPLYATNSALGVVWKCAGWKLFAGGSAIGEDALPGGAFTVADGTDYELVWQWQVHQVRVSAVAEIDVSGNTHAVVPEPVWCDVGGEVTLNVETETGANIKYMLDDASWKVSPEETEYSVEMDDSGTAGAITVKVGDKPITVTVDPHGLQPFNMVVKGSPAGCDFGVSTPPYGGINALYKGLCSARLENECVVTNGITFKCVGWELTTGALKQSGAGISATFNLTGASEFVWKWAVDLSASTAGDWAGDPALSSVALSGNLPEGTDINALEFVNVPEGWKARPKINDDGRPAAELQLDAQEWVRAHGGVNLTIEHRGIDAEIVCAVLKEGNAFTITAPERWRDENAGLSYAADWTLVTGGVETSGSGNVAEFTAEEGDEVTLVWKWAEKDEWLGTPVPPLGPGDTSPMTFSADGKRLDVNIVNTVNGWWYGLYTKTDLADSSEEWTHLKSYNAGRPATNLVFALDIDFSVPRRFFIIRLSENDPGK